MTGTRDAEPPDAGPTYAELREERDDLLRAGPVDPEEWGMAGAMSFELYVGEQRPDDLRTAADAFAQALARPGDGELWGAFRATYAQVLAELMDLDEDGGAAPAAQLDRIGNLLTAALGAIADDGEFGDMKADSHHLLASACFWRWVHDPERDRRILEQALTAHHEALARLDPGSGAAYDLQANLGPLYVDRAQLTDERADAEQAVTHFRRALATAPAEADVRPLRHQLALVLLTLGSLDRERELVEQARDEFDRARAGADAAALREPGWMWEAAAGCTFARALLWSDWGDKGQAAAAAAELDDLLAVDGVREKCAPRYLEAFARLQYERAAARGDGHGRNEALALLREALRRWQPEADGDRRRPAMLLAFLQFSRYHDDGDLDRLPVVVEAAGIVRDGGEEGIDPDAWRMLTMLLSVARTDLADHGRTERTEADERLREEAVAALPELLGMVGEGRTFVDLDTSDDSSTVTDVASLDRLRDQFDQGYAAWRQADPGSAEWSRFAAFQLMVAPLFDPHGTHITAEQKAALEQAVLTSQRDDDKWRGTAQRVVGGARLWDALHGDASGLDEAMSLLEQAQTTAAPDAAVHDGAAMLLHMGQTMQSQLTGRTDLMEEAIAAWPKLRESTHLPPYTRALGDAQFGLFQARRALRRGDLDAADGHLAEAVARHAAIDPDDPSRAQLWTLIESAGAERDLLAGRLGRPPAPPLPHRPSPAELRRQAARLPRDHAAWLLGDTGITRVYRSGGDPRSRDLTEGVALVEEALGMCDEGGDSWLRYTFTLGNCLCGLAESAPPGQRATPLARGIEHLEAALAYTSGPEHRLYAAGALTLARGYRVRGGPDDRPRSLRLGLRSLRGHAWAALLQSGTAHAAEAATDATDAAYEVADWCLRDGRPEAAVQALDACRGLALHAANTSMSVPDLLDAAGEGELAEEWRTAGGDEPPLSAAPGAPAAATVPSGLRGRVLTALTGPQRPPQSRLLLDPPEPADVAAALRAQRRDCLVYLVPAAEGRLGCAVVVTATGDVHPIPLPRLTETAGALTAYVRPQADRAAGVPRDVLPAAVAGPGGAAGDPPDAYTLRRRLDRLCAWAWDAAMQPLLGAFATATGRPPRIVLVPMGTLGLVPWHAARGPGAAEERRYALAEAEISYAASARLLCDVAGRPPVAMTGEALVVGDPTGDLPYAGEEAVAVQRAFYPRARFLGRRAVPPPDGAGTPRQVTEWLAGERAAGGVVHLACHGSVAAGARSSAYLTLHDGELAAEDLTRATTRGSHGQPALVVLAACRSQVSGRGHNESFSLAASFLVAGASSVIGSLWPVPDVATSLLMYLTHHYLHRHGATPAAALRRAQLWMFDPGRELPGDMPESMVARAGRIDPDDLSAWAWFVHLGR